MSSEQKIRKSLRFRLNQVNTKKKKNSKLSKKNKPDIEFIEDDNSIDESTGSASVLRPESVFEGSGKQYIVQQQQQGQKKRKTTDPVEVESTRTLFLKGGSDETIIPSLEQTFDTDASFWVFHGRRIIADGLEQDIASVEKLREQHENSAQGYYKNMYKRRFWVGRTQSRARGLPPAVRVQFAERMLGLWAEQTRALAATPGRVPTPLLVLAERVIKQTNNFFYVKPPRVVDFGMRLAFQHMLLDWPELPRELLDETNIIERAKGYRRMFHAIPKPEQANGVTPNTDQKINNDIINAAVPFILSDQVPLDVFGVPRQVVLSYWKKVVSSNSASAFHLVLQQFLQQLVYNGAKVFRTIPVHFYTGGMTAPLGKAPPLSRDDVHVLLDIVAREPWLTMEGVIKKFNAHKFEYTKNPILGNNVDNIVQARSNGDNKAMKLIMNQFQKFLTKAGFIKGLPHEIDVVRATNENNIKDIQNFRRHYVAPTTFGGNHDVVFMDETTVSLEQRFGRVWMARQAPIVHGTKSVLRGLHNLFITVGIVNNKPFMHWVLYRPQRLDGVALKSRLGHDVIDSFPDTVEQLAAQQGVIKQTIINLSTSVCAQKGPLITNKIKQSVCRVVGTPYFKDLFESACALADAVLAVLRHEPSRLILIADQTREVLEGFWQDTDNEKENMVLTSVIKACSSPWSDPTDQSENRVNKLYKDFTRLLQMSNKNTNNNDDTDLAVIASTTTTTTTTTTTNFTASATGSSTINDTQNQDRNQSVIYDKTDISDFKKVEIPALTINMNPQNMLGMTHEGRYYDIKYAQKQKVSLASVVCRVIIGHVNARVMFKTQMRGPRQKVRGTIGSTLDYLFGTYHRNPACVLSLNDNNNNNNLNNNAFIDVTDSITNHYATQQSRACVHFSSYHLFHALREAYAGHGVTTSPRILDVLMDNAASHMAQTMAGVTARRNPMFDIISRHGKAQLGANICSDVRLVYLPSMAPEFNPCERINALLKRHLERGSDKRFSEQMLVKQVRIFFEKIPGPSLFNIVRGCGYKFAHDAEHHKRLGETLHINADVDHEGDLEQRLTDMCNNPEPSDPKNMPLADRYYRRRHVLCVDANTGQLVKYFSPLSLNVNNMYKKRPSWVFVSKHEALFNNFLVPIHASMADSQKMLERIDAVKNVEVRYSGYEVPEVKGFALDSRKLCLAPGAPEIYNAHMHTDDAGGVGEPIACCDFWDLFMQASVNGVISGVRASTISGNLIDVIWIVETQNMGVVLRMRKATAKATDSKPFGMDSVLLKHSLILKGEHSLLELYIDKKLRTRSDYMYLTSQVALIKDKLKGAASQLKDFNEGSGWIIPLSKNRQPRKKYFRKKPISADD